MRKIKIELATIGSFGLHEFSGTRKLWNSYSR